MASERRRAAAGTRGGSGRIVAMAVTLAIGLVLALAGDARGEGGPVMPIGLTVVGGNDWRASNDFGVFWTNPVDAQVVGASSRVYGDAMDGPLEFASGLGISALEHLQVPAAGTWYLSVWLRDASGTDWVYFPGNATLRLDDVAPAISFMPGDSDRLPPQLVAAVADPLSGIADGTISFRRLDEARWTDLPTAIRVGALGTELAAVTPELKPGTSYLFGAEARDHAGNVATTTTRADGVPMQLRAPDAADGSRGPGGARGGGEARRTRLLVGLAGGRQHGRGRRSVTVDAGEPALLRGALADAEGGLEGRRLRVVVRPAGGASAGRRVESLTTDPDGRFELRLPPGPSRRLAVAFAGGDGLRPARRRLELRVRAAVSLRAAPPRLRTGGLLRLEGRVGSRGARIPRAGKLVTISYWEREAQRWRPVIVTRTDRSGRFRAAYRFRYVSGRARIRLRAAAPAEARWPYAPGNSRPVTVEVRG